MVHNCDSNCRGDYDEGGFGCPWYATCDHQPGMVLSLYVVDSYDGNGASIKLEAVPGGWRCVEGEGWAVRGYFDYAKESGKVLSHEEVAGLIK